METIEKVSFTESVGNFEATYIEYSHLIQAEKIAGENIRVFKILTIDRFRNFLFVGNPDVLKQIRDHNQGTSLYIDRIELL